MLPTLASHNNINDKEMTGVPSVSRSPLIDMSTINDIYTTVLGMS